MDLRRIYLNVKKIIENNYTAGTPELIEGQVRRYLKQYKVFSKKQMKAVRMQIENQIAKKFVKETTSDIKPVLDKMLKSEFALVQGSVNAKIVESVKRGIRSKMTMKEMSRLINRNVEVGKHHSNTISRSATVANNRAGYIRKALESGAKKFTLKGPSSDRKFYKENFGKELTISEIVKLRNDSGLSPLVFCCGYNCRHRWQAVL